MLVFKEGLAKKAVLKTVESFIGYFKNILRPFKIRVK